MLELVILKTQHGGFSVREAELEARKVLPFILNCDVFSIEGARCTKKQAVEDEKIWNQIISANFSRSHYLEAERTSNQLIGKRDEPSIEAYTAKIREYLFRQKKPIYHGERWENTDAINKLSQDFHQGIANVSRGLKLASKGDGSGLEIAYEGFKGQMPYILARDGEIAKNLIEAEATIRTAYPSINKEKIKLAIQLGQLHRLERFVTLPYTIESLGAMPEEIIRIYDAAENQVPLENARPLLVKIANEHIKLF